MTSIIGWEATVRRAEERQRQQRSGAANRRAAALLDGVEETGTQAAVAAALGTSEAAVSKAIGQAERRETRPALADYLELDLPRVGAAVPSPEEWEELETERPEVASRARDTWAALAVVTHQLQQQAQEACEYLADIAVYGPDDDEDTPLPALLRGQEDELEERATISMIHAYGDMAATLHERSLAAWREQDWWRQTALELDHPA